MVGKFCFSCFLFQFVFFFPGVFHEMMTYTGVFLSIQGEPIAMNSKLVRAPYKWSYIRALLIIAFLEAHLVSFVGR